jgi:NAD(P)-dependent dehydrogenase (short-subunit alcohol dehydrogenase family)
MKLRASRRTSRLPVPCPSDEGHRRNPQETRRPDLPRADDGLVVDLYEALRACSPRDEDVGDGFARRTQAAARQMIAQGEGGVIINRTSINSGLANPRVATYAITKGGMNQITGTAAVAFARNGIRVVGVGPGTIDTEMVRGEFVSDATEQAILSRTPLGRYGTAAEIAAVVAFLASDEASYITGETIYPDGGRRVLNYVMPNKQ